FVPGRGVFGHPLGPDAGAASIRQAWEACRMGLAIERHAETHLELRSAIAAFGQAPSTPEGNTEGRP
ncbi:MAG: ribulose 1,5-bisphosphate carboxylase, partial [Chromatiaceae bacterium]|nr:ribulose 1,5-bisphosphate carboxylase [Chromatiaceae bacterium]